MEQLLHMFGRAEGKPGYAQLLGNIFGFELLVCVDGTGPQRGAGEGGF